MVGFGFSLGISERNAPAAAPGTPEPQITSSPTSPLTMGSLDAGTLAEDIVFSYAGAEDLVVEVSIAALGLGYTLTTLTPGGLTVTGDNTDTLTLEGSLADINAALEAGQFQYTTADTGEDAGTYTDALTISVRRSSGSVADSVAIDVTVVVPPLITCSVGSTAFTEGDDPVAVDASIEVASDSVTSINSATVTISGNYQSGEDVLSVVNANGITGSWNSGTGVLTLSNTASLANYQAILRTVKYENTSITPNESNRTITFVVNDGTYTSDDNASSSPNKTLTVTGTVNPNLVAQWLLAANVDDNIGSRDGTNQAIRFASSKANIDYGAISFRLSDVPTTGDLVLALPTTRLNFSGEPTADDLVLSISSNTSDPVDSTTWGAADSAERVDLIIAALESITGVSVGQFTVTADSTDDLLSFWIVGTDAASIGVDAAWDVTGTISTENDTSDAVDEATWNAANSATREGLLVTALESMDTVATSQFTVDAETSDNLKHFRIAGERGNSLIATSAFDVTATLLPPHILIPTPTFDFSGGTYTFGGFIKLNPNWNVQASTDLFGLLRGTWHSVVCTARIESGAVEFLAGNDAHDYDPLNGSTPIDDGNEHHVALTCEVTTGQTIMRIVIDGVEDTSQTLAYEKTITDPGTHNLMIGGLNTDGQEPINSSYAVMDATFRDFRVYDTALSDGEIQAEWGL